MNTSPLIREGGGSGGVSRAPQQYKSNTLNQNAITYDNGFRVRLSHGLVQSV